MRRYYLIGIVVLVVGLAGWHVAHTSHGTSPQSPQSAAATPGATQADHGQTDTALAGIITSWAGQQNFRASVVVSELTGTRRSAAYDQSASVVPASTFKLYVAYAILHGIEQGKYSFATVTDDGNTIQTDLDIMITDSDDPASRTLGFLAGWTNINALLKSQGMTATDLNNYVGSDTDPVGDKHTTANDLSIFLHKLYAGQLLDQAHTQLLLGLMEHQVWRERVPAGVPAGVTVADKPGWLLAGDDSSGVIVENDAAIVYGPKSTYVLVITTTGGTTQPLANLSKLVYNHLES